MANMIYETEPFVVENGTEVVVKPIEPKKKKREQKNITQGVLLKNNKPADGYILKIFKVTKNGKNSFVGFTITDSFGQFTIPISAASKTEYVIKVYSLTEEIDNLEIVL